MRSKSTVNARIRSLLLVFAILAGMAGSLAIPSESLAYRACSKSSIVPGADLHDCDFVFVQLIAYNVPNINFSGANLAGSILLGTIFTSANFSSTILTSSSMVQTDLTGASMGQAVMKNADLTIATAVGTRFDSADLSSAKLIDGNFVSANFSGANLNGADLEGANLTSAKFAGANLFGASLKNANLSGASLLNANLANIRSGGIVGTPTSMAFGWRLFAGYLLGPSANLTGASLIGRDLRNDNLDGANFKDANLIGSRLTKANLTGANWNNTICPDGTNSNNHQNSCVNNLKPAPYALIGGSTSTNGESATKVRDGDGGTSWRTKSSVSRPKSAWVSVKLEGNVTVAQVRWRFGVGSIADSFKVQANTSCNVGATSGWTTLTTRSNAAVGTWQAYTPSSTFKACQIRFIFTNPNNDGRLGGISEVEVRRPGGTS